MGYDFEAVSIGNTIMRRRLASLVIGYRCNRGIKSSFPTGAS
jgi:hypothetical protein